MKVYVTHASDDGRVIRFNIKTGINVTGVLERALGNLPDVDTDVKPPNWKNTDFYGWNLGKKDIEDYEVRYFFAFRLGAYYYVACFNNHWRDLRLIIEPENSDNLDSVDLTPLVKELEKLRLSPSERVICYLGNRAWGPLFMITSCYIPFALFADSDIFLLKCYGVLMLLVFLFL